MLGWRLILSLMLSLALIGLFAADAWTGSKAPILWALASLLAVRSTWELVQLFRVRFDPNFRLLACLAVAVVSANWLVPIFADEAPATAARDLAPPMLAYEFSVMALFVGGMIRFRAPGKTIEMLGSELVALSYVALFISLTVQLRWIDAEKLGYLPLASLVLATKSGDIAAYTAGRLLGKAKLCPLISPGKTWAGAIGALCGSAAASWAFFRWATGWLTGAQPGPWYAAVFYGLCLGLVGLTGDLAESLLKRDVGQKDSAALLPGFGGLLDLLDSVIFSGPVAYLLWLVLPLTG